jgi:uncharacterized protein
MSKSSIHGNFLWYELLTTDAGLAKGFYDRVLGWRMGETSSSPEMDYRMIQRADGQMTAGVLTLTAEMRANGASACWLGYIGVDSCDKACAEAVAKGGSILMAPRDVPMAGRIAMLTDCCGAPYYVMTPSPPPGGGESTAFSPTLIGACSWNELVCDKPDEAIAFYTSLYGWGTPEPMDMGPMGKYQFLEHDGLRIGAIMRKPDATPVSCWTPYFRVTDIESAVATAKTAGAKLLQGVHNVPGGDRIANLLDPEGAGFALVSKG